MEDVKMNEIREIYNGEIVCIKLTRKNISQLSNGKILEGYKTRIMLEDENEN
jgi:hypothetical protein